MPEEREGDQPRMELLPPKSEIAPSRWQTFMSKPNNRAVVSTISGATLFGLFLWSISEFFSVRGVVHMLTSRIFLGVACVTAWLLLVLIGRIFGWSKLSILLCATVLIIAALVLDSMFPMPNKIQKARVMPDLISFRMGCEWKSLPIHVPAGTTVHVIRVYELTLNAAKAKAFDIGVFESVSAKPDSAIDWPSPKRDGRWMTHKEVNDKKKSGSMPNSLMSKCTLTSYSNVTVDDIATTLLVDTPDKHRHAYSVPFNPLMAGQSFSFYLVNVCSSGVIPILVQWDDFATVRVLGEEQWRKVPLRYERNQVPSQLVATFIGPSSFLWNGVESCKWNN